MKFKTPDPFPKWRAAFTLVEMLVVIAIISILMTLGSVGLSSVGSKGVTSAVATAEALFDEAHNNAVGRNLRTAVLVAKTLTNNPAEDLRRMVVVYEETDADGAPKEPDNESPNWVLSSRGATLPEKTFFSSRYSKLNHSSGSGDIPTIPHTQLKRGTSAVRQAYYGEWYLYEFNSQGIAKNPGASFVVGNGVRPLTQSAEEKPPRVAGSAKRDFGGFIIWRNGRTSVFRNPDQMGLPSTISDF
ncbi:MAG: pilus assembly FimT family protein [Luteolibacter sp.]